MDNNDRFRRPSDGRLPPNRKELFLEVLWWHFSYFLAIGLLSLAFFLPNIAVLTYNDIAASVISQGSEDIASKIVTLRLQTSLPQVVSYIMLFFGASGVFISTTCMGCSDVTLFGLVARGKAKFETLYLFRCLRRYPYGDETSSIENAEE